MTNTTPHAIGDTGAEFTAKGNNALLRNPHGKPDREAYFLVSTGQSNSVSYTDPVVYPQPPYNDQIFDWNEDIDGGGNWSWRVAHDMQFRDRGTYTTAPAVGIGGYLGVTTSNPPRASQELARLINKATGRPVYILHVTYSGQSVTQWIDTGACDAAFATHAANALAAIPADIRPPCADAVLWMQGESDLGAGMGSSTYHNHLMQKGDGDSFFQRGEDVHGYIDKNITQMLIVDLLEDYGTFDGFTESCRLSSQRKEARAVSLVNTNGFKRDTHYWYDNVAYHMLGDGAIQIGRNAFPLFMAASNTWTERNRVFSRNTQRELIDSATPHLLWAELLPSGDTAYDETGPKKTTGLIGKFKVSGWNADYSKRFYREINFQYLVTNDVQNGTLHFDDAQVVDSNDEGVISNITVDAGSSGIFGNLNFWVSLLNQEGESFWVNSRLEIDFFIE